MKTSPTTFTSARFAPVNSAGGLKYGPASYAGPFSTSVALRNGPKMKERLLRMLQDNKRAVNHFLHVPGAVLDAIYLMKHFLPLTRVGVRKKSTLDLCPVYPHTPADRHVRGHVEAVPTHVTKLVMLVHVRHALPWDRHRTVSVDEILPQNDVRIQIMSMVGAAARSVETCFRAVNIPAHLLVMRAYVVPVRSRLRPGAIVAKCRPRCCAVPRRMKWKVER